MAAEGKLVHLVQYCCCCHFYDQYSIPYSRLVMSSIPFDFHLNNYSHERASILFRHTGLLGINKIANCKVKIPIQFRKHSYPRQIIIREIIHIERKKIEAARDHLLNLEFNWVSVCLGDLVYSFLIPNQIPDVAPTE